MRCSLRLRTPRLESTCWGRQSGSRRLRFARPRYRFLIAGMVALLPALAAGQTPSPAPEGVENGNYNYQGSVEFGYRFVNTNGSQPVYDTFVNQQQGPRLLQQTLSMRSLNHQGVLFDNLFLSSFGWGGDPENATRLRVSKNKWYNFNWVFRRDQNVWDYNLLANPLNPPNSFIQVVNSPHEMLTTRRMYDYNLTLLPQSAVRFRLAYTRNNMEGLAFSSLHEGTDTILFQNTRTLLDGYQAGIDIRLLPRTNISYDQFLQYYRGDTSWNDRNFGFQLANGSPVDAGMIYNPTANQPCSNIPVPIFNTTTTPPTLKATCNGYQGYSRFAPIRTSYPTEQLTLQSSYFRRLDLSARASYSSADTKVNNFAEDLLGLIARTGQRAFNVTGPARAKRVVANADLGITVRITDKFRLTDSFRFSNFRIPGAWTPSTLSFFNGVAPASMLSPVVVFDPAVCPADPAACPQHGNSSPADVATTSFARFLGQDSKYNTIEAEYDFSKHFGGRLGYRYGHRTIPVHWITTTNELFFPSNPNRGDCTGLPLNADGTCSFSGEIDSEDDHLEVNEHSALFGLWAHPNDALRMNFDLELFSADFSPTRTTPRNLQRYKTRINYKPREWINVSGTVNILESRNNVTDVLHREHDRNYGFTLAVNPNPKFGFEFGYNYDDIFSTTNICYVFGFVPPPGTTSCAGSGGAPFISGVSLYDNKINFGYVNFMVKPVKRLTANLGYNLTSTSGNTTILNPTPNTLGPLGLNFHKPSAWVDFDLAKGLTWRTAWGHFDYNEKSSPGPLPARDFQSNSAILSLRYDF
jgi:hypothetical protein